FAPAKADLQPDRAVIAKDLGRVDRPAFGVFIKGNAARAQVAQILGQIALLALAQSLAMTAAVKVTARRFRVEFAHALSRVGRPGPAHALRSFGSQTRDDHRHLGLLA